MCRRGLQGNINSRGDAREFDEPVAPDPEAGSSLRLPVIIHHVEPIVAVSTARRVGRVEVGAPDDAYRKTFCAAARQCEVPPRQALVRYLSAALRVSSA